MMRIFALALISSLSLSAFAQTGPVLNKFGLAQSQQVSTLLTTPLSQTKVANCADATREITWGRSTRISYTSDGLSISGLGAGGRSWNTLIPASNVLKCEIWSAKLTRSAKPALLVFQAPNSGQVFGGELTVLAFDSSDMPFPWQSDGGFTSSSAGIDQIAKDPSSGDARVLVPQRTGDPHDGYGYVTSLFKGSSSGLNKVLGKDTNGASWPDVQGRSTSFTANELRMTRTASPEGATALSSSNTVKVISAIHPKDDQQITYSDGSVSRYPKLIVWDKPDQSRTIYMNEYAIDGAAELLRAKVPVLVKGTACEDDECGPFIMQSEQTK